MGGNQNVPRTGLNLLGIAALAEKLFLFAKSYIKSEAPEKLGEIERIEKVNTTTLEQINNGTINVLAADLNTGSVLANVTKAVEEGGAAAAEVVEEVCEAGGWGAKFRDLLTVLAHQKWLPVALSAGILTVAGMTLTPALAVSIASLALGVLRWITSLIQGGVKGTRETIQNRLDRKSREDIAQLELDFKRSEAAKRDEQARVDEAMQYYNTYAANPALARINTYRGTLQKLLLDTHSKRRDKARMKHAVNPMQANIIKLRGEKKRAKLLRRLADLQALERMVAKTGEDIATSRNPEEIRQAAKSVNDSMEYHARFNKGFGKIGKSNRQPWQVKGSVAAKRRMAYLRSLRRK